MVEKILNIIRPLIPRRLFKTVQPAYHFMLALFGALLYWFPSRQLTVIGVTGTKGKTSTVELINTIFERAGFKTALSSTLRFKIGNESSDNRYKMTMPGRLFIHRFLRQAVREGCKFVIVEMTSEGVKQFRHKFIELDALVFLNLTPEHIESHGSFEKYADAKLELGRALIKSKKKQRVMVANREDAYGSQFLSMSVDESFGFALADAEPYTVKKEGVDMTWEGEKISLKLSGAFNLSNALAAATVAKAFDVSPKTISDALADFTGIPGRVERIHEGQDFTVIVDYAHTPDSLEKLYQVFDYANNICVLGNTGGGRDTWKRPVMARIAEQYCEEVILTNEDPYDEDPQKIVDEMAAAMGKKPKIIMDRREAIKTALSHAKTGDAVLITGKGTDPYIVGPKGEKTPWSDAKVVREELKNLLAKK